MDACHTGPRTGWAKGERLLIAARGDSSHMLPDGGPPIDLLDTTGASPRAIEDQELLLDEYGLSHDGTRAARPDEPDEGRHEVQKQDGQVAHRTMLTS
jgi:hypothetical protein